MKPLGGMPSPVETLKFYGIRTDVSGRGSLISQNITGDPAVLNSGLGSAVFCLASVTASAEHHVFSLRKNNGGYPSSAKTPGRLLPALLYCSESDGITRRRSTRRMERAWEI